MSKIHTREKGPSEAAPDDIMSWSPTLSLKVQNPGLAVPPGIHLNCYGPFFMPEGARALRTFLPDVDMSIVYHMIMFGGSGATGMRFGAKPGNSNLCYQVP